MSAPLMASLFAEPTETEAAVAAPTAIAAPMVELHGEEPAEEPPFYWSSSRLKRMLQCPRQFRYVYVDKLQTVPGAAMVFGRILHEIIRFAHEEQMASGVLPKVDVLLERFEEVWTKVTDNIELRYAASGPDAKGYLTAGREMLRVFRSSASCVEPPLAVELPFEMELEIQVGGEPRTVRLRGVIDRLDEIKLECGEPALIVVDYKSGRRKVTQADANEEIQLTIYALAAREVLGLPVEQVELFALRDGETASSVRTQYHADWLTRQVLPYAERTLEKGAFPAAPGYWCRFCEFRQQCDQEGPGPGIEPQYEKDLGGEEIGETD